MDFGIVLELVVGVGVGVEVAELDCGVRVDFGVAVGN